MPSKPLLIAEVLSRRVKDVRKTRGFTQEQLATRLEAIGHPMDRATLAKIELGGTRARNLSVVDVLALAYALDVAPVWLILPKDGSDVAITPHVVVTADEARDWIAGVTLPLFKSKWRPVKELHSHEAIEERNALWQAERSHTELRAYQRPGIGHLVTRVHALVKAAAARDTYGMRWHLDAIQAETERQLADRELAAIKFPTTEED